MGKLFSYCSDGTASVSIMAGWAAGENFRLEVLPNMQSLLCFALSTEQTQSAVPAVAVPSQLQRSLGVVMLPWLRILFV